jgi:hypothetical protein
MLYIPKGIDHFKEQKKKYFDILMEKPGIRKGKIGLYSSL